MEQKKDLLDLTLRELLEHKIRIIRIMAEALYKELMEQERASK